MTDTTQNDTTQNTVTPEDAIPTYTERLQASGTPILGMVCWYSVTSKAEISYSDFSDLIDLYDAPIEKKKAPNKAHVFRRACTEATLKKQLGPFADTFCNYKVSNAGDDSDYVYRSVVEETVDGKEHKLGHRVVANMSFNKTSGKVKFTDEIPGDDFAAPAYSRVKTGITNFLRIKSEVIHDLPIRESARQAVEYTLQGVRVRPGGGVYFVSNDRSEDLEAVNSVINSIPESSFHMLPLPDDPEQRQMLKDEFESEVLEHSGKLLDELTEALTSGEALTARKFTDLLDRYELIRDKTVEFSDLLNDSLSTAKTQVNLMKKQITQLTSSIES